MQQARKAASVTAVRDRVLYQKTSLLVVDALTGVEAESVYTVHP
jgi:hypothetical protein